MNYPLISEYVDAVRSVIAYIHKKLSNVLFRLLAVVKSQKLKVIGAEEELSTEVTDEDLKDAFIDEFGVKYSRDGKRLLVGTDIRVGQYKVRKGTRTICNGAFWNCHSLRKISIPEGVTSIGDMAFRWCGFLQEILLPKGVASIGDEAFDGCCSLREISIPKEVTSIGGGVFCGCRSLQEISIPTGVTNISVGMF